MLFYRYICVFYICLVFVGFYFVVVFLMMLECGKLMLLVFVYGVEGDNGNFIVCVILFNFNYSKVYELVEMIEFNKIFGVFYFVFYSYSINKNV